MKSLCLSVLLLAIGSTTLALQADTSTLGSENEALFTGPTHFLEMYCLQCHGEEKQKGDRRFDSLGLELSDEDRAFDWQEILDMVNLGEMPPEDEPQPSDEELSGFVKWITPKLENFYAHHSHQESSGLRRLNTFQYLNTLRDLLGLNLDSFNPVASFPSEERLEGFKNIGSTLVISHYLMEQYLEAISASIDKVIGIPSKPPRIQENFAADDFWDRGFRFRARQSYFVNPNGTYVEIGNGDKSGGRLYPRSFKGVPMDGYYTITVKAEGVGRQNPYDASLFNADLSEPIKLELFANDASIESARNENPTSRKVVRVDLDDNVPQEFQFRVWLDKGFNFGFRYANGPVAHRRTLLRIQERYHPETITTNYKDVFSDEPSEKLDYYLSDVYEGPRVRIHYASIEGPEIDIWPPQSYQNIMGANRPEKVSDDPYWLIGEFARKAFRRPVLPAELKLYQNFFDEELKKGSPVFQAIVDTYKAILCSPNFIYIEAPFDEAAMAEIGGDFKEKLKAYALAARLSYFLWGSMPDQELLDAAENGSLFAPIEVKYQALRMLRDPRAEAFVSSFTDGWLGLDRLGQIVPDPNKFEFYETRELAQSMREETRAYFRHMLFENRNIEEFLSGEYSFVDRNLAKHYGIDYSELGDAHEPVYFPENSLRGGLLGQAGIHTVTANGVDTSPVVRGVWILENILGTPPSPPPPDVPALEPDIRGATSIRDQLAKHRDIATCNECHRKMDPLGFALENFDAIGGYRDFYKDGQGNPSISVDSSGKLPSGAAFDDVRGLKEILMNQGEQFSRCLTEKLMMYALGRELTFSDRPQINSILEELDRRGGGLQDLVEIVVSSETFLSK